MNSNLVKNIIIYTCLSPLLFCFFSCKRKTKVEWGTKNKILLLGNGAEPKALDPHIVSSVGESNIIRSLFEGLIIHHPSVDTIDVPGVAEKWQSNEDFSEWTFYLRKNAKWSNGDPVTSKDFIYAWNRILHPDMAAPYASMLYFLKNAENYNKGKIKDFSKVGAKAIDDYTIKCELKSSTPFLPDVVKHITWLPVHKKTIENFGGMTTPYTKWQKPGNHVSNGPFTLKDWKINAYVKVDRNAHYWDNNNVKLNGIHFYPIENIFTEEKTFRNGLIHYTYSMPQNLIAYYKNKKDPNLKMETYYGTYFYRCNVDVTPTNNINFRKALTYSIDRSQIVNYVTKGGQLPAYAFTPPSKYGYSPPKTIKYDPKKALRYLKKSGYENGSLVPEFSIFINTSESHKSIAVAIQDMWKKNLGIQNVKIRNQEWKVFRQSIRDLKYEVSRGGWIGDYIDPTSFLDMWLTNNSNNNTNWSNSKYDNMLSKSLLINNQKERFKKLQQAEKVLLNELPIIPIYWHTRVYLIHNDVKNWNPLLLDSHSYKYIDLIKTK